MSTSERVVKNESNSTLCLNGDKIFLGERPASKVSTASSRCSMLTKCYSRPVSAVPLLTLKDKLETNDREDYKKRPFSAGDFLPVVSHHHHHHRNRFNNNNNNVSLESLDDNSRSSELTSSTLLKTLLNEPIQFPSSSSSTSWSETMNYQSIKVTPTLPSLLSTGNDLKPGIVTKPPLPLKKPIDNNIKKDENDGSEAIHNYLTLKYDTNNKGGGNSSSGGGVETGSSDESAINSLNLEELAVEGETEKMNNTTNTVQIQNWIEEKEKAEMDETFPNLSEMDLDELFKDETDKKFDKFFRIKKKTTTHRVKFTPTPIKSGLDYKENNDNENKDEVETWIGKTQQQDEKQQVSSTAVSFLDILNSFNENDEEKNIDLLKDDDISQDLPQHDVDTVTTTSSFDDIAGLLEVLEAEDKKSQMKIESMKQIVETETKSENKQQKQQEPTNSLQSSPNYSELLSFLDQVDQSCSQQQQQQQPKTTKIIFEQTKFISLDTIPKLDDLLLCSNEELARLVIDLNLNVKDKSSTIHLLQNELSQLRTEIITQTQKSNQTIKEKLKQQKTEYEATIKRHQKFIDQLMNDKKGLNQQCESLLNEMKTLEERFQSNLKAMEHKHHVEMQKAKEMHLAGEKLRRERWIDNKTAKIKELTVKSIEPELQSMEKRQQQELADLRSLHKRELEDLELKAARKMQEQLEQLRNQMIEEREKALTQEREIVRKRYEEMVLVEEQRLQDQRKKLHNEYTIRMQECEEREAAALAEKERGIKQAQQEFEDRLQVVVRRHANEIKLVRDTTRLEMDAWQTNVKKQQQIELIAKESVLREQCRKERDKEIEVIIERLESEAAEQRHQIEESCENRIRRMREKYQKELRELEESEQETKNKYLHGRKVLANLQDELVVLKTTIKHLENQLESVNGIKEKLEKERDEMKEIIRKEVKAEMTDLENELAVIKQSRDKELQQLYSRVKVSVTRKDEIVAELTQENKALQEKCSYLENMLEQQRKEYFIK